MLPFVCARVFRTTCLEVFALSNFQLGSAFSVYGMVAMASYFFGGPLADRFAARTLIVLALVATASGGIVFATIPSIRSEEHTSELQSLMRNSYAVFRLKNKTHTHTTS